MKKLLSLTLGAVMCFALASGAFAGPAPLSATNEMGDIVINSSKVDINIDKVLTPGEEYMFPINVTLDGFSGPLTQEDLDTHYLRISKTGKGNTVSSIKLVRTKGVYNLQISVKDGYPAKLAEEEYTLKLSKKSGGTLLSTVTLTFETGYRAVDDAYVDNLGMEDYISISRDTPVFTKNQLEKISKLNDYKKVTFTDRNWNFVVNVTDTDNINMLNDGSVVTDILDKYPTYNVEFINFPGRPTFRSQGRMEVDVADISELYGQKFYVYSYDKGVLTQLSATYNKEDDILSFPAKTLTHFVISDSQFPYLNVNPNPNPGTGAAA